MSVLITLFLRSISTMTDSTSRAATKRKDKGDARDKGRRHRSVGETMGSARYAPCLPPTLGRHLDLDQTGREWAGGLGFLYKRKRKTGGRRGLSSTRVGPCPSPATGGSVDLLSPPRSLQIFGQRLLRIAAKSATGQAVVMKLKVAMTLRHKLQKNLRRSSGRGENIDLVSGFSSRLCSVP